MEFCCFQNLQKLFFDEGLFTCNEKRWKKQHHSLAGSRLHGGNWIVGKTSLKSLCTGTSPPNSRFSSHPPLQCITSLIKSFLKNTHSYLNPDLFILTHFNLYQSLSVGRTADGCSASLSAVLGQPFPSASWVMGGKMNSPLAPGWQEKILAVRSEASAPSFPASLSPRRGATQVALRC